MRPRIGREAYTEDDFVGPLSAGHVNKVTARVLPAIDRLPRG